MAFIEDPRNAKRAFINQDNRLEVAATNTGEQLVVTGKGHGYNINTGLIGLTSTSESGVLYFENHEDHEIIVEALAFGLDDLGTHSGKPLITVVRNPSSVSFSTDVDINCNRNFSSSNTLKSTTLAYKGAEGATVTGGEDCLLLHASTGSRLYATINLVLGVGNSLAVKIDPQVTSGTCSLYAALIMYTHEDID